MLFGCVSHPLFHQLSEFFNDHLLLFYWIKDHTYVQINRTMDIHLHVYRIVVTSFTCIIFKLRIAPRKFTCSNIIIYWQVRTHIILGEAVPSEF